MNEFLDWQAQLSWSQSLVGLLFAVFVLIGLVLFLAWVIVELEDRGSALRLHSYELTLRGVSSCSTCVACRNAARRTLEGEFL